MAAWLSGPGTVKGNLTNAGEVDLGSSAGMLTIIGNYTQTSAGTLSLKIGGTTAGSQFDQVNVSGTATYGGTLTAQLTNGFGPAFPEAFTVLTAQGGSTGSFATTNMPSIDGHDRPVGREHPEAVGRPQLGRPPSAPRTWPCRAAASP